MVTANETDKPLTGVDTFLENRAVRRDNAEFESAQNRLFFIAVILSAAVLIAVYAFSPASRVQAISIKGNSYLDKAYIQKISEVSLDDFFYLQMPSAIAGKVKLDPAVEDASVAILKNNIVEITVKEKQPIGYRYDTDTPTLLFTDGSECNLTSEYMSMLSRIPFISGFSDEEKTHRLTTNFANVSREAIEEMAEVIQYPLSYDPEAIEIRMRDGGIFFCSYYSVALINDYRRIRNLMIDQEKCLYADNGTTVAVARACPWNEVKPELEYWTDEEGNFIYNKWGDKAVRHYYQDSNGGYYLDEEGNRILIPIDAYGSDIKDSDFLNHYMEGWYAHGYLEEPEPTEEELAALEAENGEAEAAEGGEKTSEESSEQSSEEEKPADPEQPASEG